MMQDYPRFTRGDYEKAYNALTEKEKETLYEFEKYCSIGAGVEKVKDMKRHVLKIKLVVGSFDAIDLKALRHFLYLLETKSGSTKDGKNNVKVDVRYFLRWYFKDWSKRFDEFNDIKFNAGMNEEKINAGTLLKKEEIEAIIKRTDSLFWKAYFLTQYEGGLRTKEARNIKWSDVRLNVDGEISEINIYSTKTSKARVVYVKQATFYLKRLKEETDRKSPYVFPSVASDNDPVSKFSVSRFFNSHVSKVVGRKLWAYVLRHSRATELYLNAKIPKITAQKFMGHSKDMSNVYVHISNADIKEAMAKSVYNFDELPPEQKQKLEEQIRQLKEKYDTQMGIILEELERIRVEAAVRSKHHKASKT